MFDDNAARRALHTLTDEPAPPVVTTLDQVLKRGRRRVFVQRAGAVAGVMAVVAAIGVSTVLLRPGDEQDGLQVAGPTSPPDTSQSVPSSHAGTTPPITSSNTDAPPPPAGQVMVVPGWDEMLMPNSPAGPCNTPYIPLPPEPEIDILPQDVVQPAFVGAVESVIKESPSVAMAEWEAHSPKADGPRGYVAVEFSVGNGNAQVQLEAVRYGGTPTEIADASLATYGNCDPPLRRKLSDGTVMQLYPPNGADSPSPTQPLQIYRPDNRMYIVTAAGYSERDTTPHGGLAGGRGAVPLTAEQLADVATRLVANLR